MQRLGWAAVLVFLELGCIKSPEFYLERGNQSMVAGKYADAEIQYRKSIQKAPQYAEAYYRLGLLEYKLQHGLEALADFQRAMSLQPSNQRYGMDLASVAIEAYQVMPDKKYLYDQAVQEAAFLLKKDPNSFDGLRLSGDIAMIDRKYDDALADYHKANRLRPHDPNVTLAMTQLLFLREQDAEGEELIRQFLETRKDYPPIYDLLESHYLRRNRPEEAERLIHSEIAVLPANVQARLRLAKLYRTLGRTAEMSQTLAGIVANRAAFPDGAAQAGDFYAHYGEWDKALAQYRGGLQNATGSGKLLYHRKVEQALEALGENNEALAELNEILKANPDDPDARLNRAILLRQSRTLAERASSSETLKALAVQYPQDPIVSYNLAVSYLDRGDYAAAQREASKSADLRQDYAAPRLLLAQVAQAEHNDSRALEAVQEVLALHPDNIQARLIRATALIQSNSYRQAVSELNAAAKLQPNSEEVKLAFAALETAENNYSKAEALYRKIYRPGSGDLRPLKGLIEICVLERRPEQAQKLLESEAQQNPKSAQVYSALGDWYRQQGNAQGALASYEKARELAPDDPKTLNAVAVLESNQGRARQAIAMLNRELAIDPNNATAMNNLAFDLAETGQDLDRARSLAESVARKFPDNPAVIDTLGWVYTQRGMNESAIEVLRGLVKKNPNEPAYHYHLAIALLHDKRPADAKTEFQAALRQNPSKELSGEIQANLAQVR